jgi:hypothetical protein
MPDQHAHLTAMSTMPTTAHNWQLSTIALVRRSGREDLAKMVVAAGSRVRAHLDRFTALLKRHSLPAARMNPQPTFSDTGELCHAVVGVEVIEQAIVFPLVGFIFAHRGEFAL